MGLDMYIYRVNKDKFLKRKSLIDEYDRIDKNVTSTDAFKVFVDRKKQLDSDKTLSEDEHKIKFTELKNEYNDRFKDEITKLSGIRKKLDEIDDEYGSQEMNDTPTQDNQVTSPEEDPIDEPIQDTGSANEPLAGEPSEDTFILELLKSRGIEDPSKIKFENDNGEIEEIDWNTLDTNDKLNILNSSNTDIEEGLDASEIELINAIRESELTPAEYMQYLQRTSVENYIQNAQNQGQVYSVDQYSDDELFVMDLISRSEEITEEEALEALERAKSNEALFKKQIGATRKAYKEAEEESLQYARLKQEQEAQDQFNQFAEKIEDSILNFKAFSGGQISMSNDDMQDLYTFITGVDNAGNSWFGKALQDPDTIVRMAWFELNGEKMLQDITDYYEKEIANVRKESYKKGIFWFLL